MWADIRSVTDTASIGTSGMRDGTAGGTELSDSWGWREARQECHFQPLSPGEAGAEQ